MNGAHRPDLGGCTDIDLTCTPFTKSLPIRRLGLDIGATDDVRCAMVDVETLELVATRQRYERLALRRFRHTNLDSGICTDLDVDQYGLVHDFPDHFRRT
jgi:hypothetical protein